MMRLFGKNTGWRAHRVCKPYSHRTPLFVRAGTPRPALPHSLQPESGL